MTERTASMIDWDVAVRVGSKLAGDGPVVSSAEAIEAVGELREGASKASPLVRDYTGLSAGVGTAPVLVTDRRGWIQANADAFATILTPLMDRMVDRKKTPPSKVTQAVGSRVSGTEVGAMLGFLGGKVLGQFDPFHQAPGANGRLLLVAPNIVYTERELDVDPHDFRLWVCLHEETHRVQFTAVPWMREHLLSLMGQVVNSMPVDPWSLFSDAVGRASEVFAKDSQASLVDMVSTPEQRKVVDEITGVMSLLEGHADVVMDGVGPEVIATVATIRRRFNQRRKGAGSLDRVIRRLLGLDQKMAQYRDGAKFVRSVIDQVGMDGFNAVFAEPVNLPSKQEIHDPGAWVARVRP